MERAGSSKMVVIINNRMKCHNPENNIIIPIHNGDCNSFINDLWSAIK
jgi:hypothetical protein